MKIIHRYKLGQPICVSFKYGVDSLINGLFGLTSTEMVNMSNRAIAEKQLQAQREENQLNRDYNTAEAEKSRNFVNEQRLRSQEYQTQMVKDTPQLQVQGMREAGINPAVAFGHGTGVATGGSSVPSGTSAPSASFSTGLSPVPYQAANPAVNFQQIAQGLSSLASAKEKGANVGLIEKQIENMAVDTETKQVLKEGYRLSNELQKIDLKYKDKKVLQELQEQVIRMVTTRSQGKMYSETARIQSSIENLNNSLANYHGQHADYMRLEVANYTTKLNSLLKLQGAQVKEANASAVEHYASAEYKKELAETERKLREGTIEMQSLHNDLLTLDKFLKGNEQKISDATFEAQLFATLEQLYREGLISENIYKEGQILSVKRDWASRQEFANYMSNVVGAAASATNAYANVRGVSVRRLNAKERNQIQDKFVNEFRQRGQFERENKIYNRQSDDSWPMYMPYD